MPPKFFLIFLTCPLYTSLIRHPIQGIGCSILQIYCIVKVTLKSSSLQNYTARGATCSSWTPGQNLLQTFSLTMYHVSMPTYMTGAYGYPQATGPRCNCCLCAPCRCSRPEFNLIQLDTQMILLWIFTVVLQTYHRCYVHGTCTAAHGRRYSMVL